MENPPFSVSSFASFATLLEACVVNKISAGNDTFCNGVGLPLEIEGLLAKEQQHFDSSPMVQLEEVSHNKGIFITHSLVNKDANTYSNVLKGAHNGPIMDIPTSKPMNLKFYQPLQSGNRKCVSPPMEVAKDGSKAWKNCLVGYFIEKKLPFSLVNNIAMRIWGNRGLLKVLTNDKGFYFFKFSNDKACSNVLEVGP
ncbi:hypothetical protein LWI29_009030 [Acer saccharum]|uniref:DUF4283 domain-containing protein n=1 Tax=Acer saccharum TaxID=4024 RepID=A0AA39RCM0_ACESA|nr:hypothetical protein LWI29_009030 [Acer saccharum]